ncbi:aminotransferase class IV [Nautilia lithotrophica]
MKFIETILITDKIENLNLHNNRMNKTRYNFFKAKPLNLKDYIEIKPNKRVRVTYSEKIENIEYFDIIKREFNSFKIVYSDIDYQYKYADRDKLNALKDSNFDEVIIIKKGFVTDTTISNLAFFDGKEWYTPKTPLLKGTKREELIQKGFLKEKDISINDIKKYKKFAMLNAIVGFYERDITCISF